MALNKGFWDPEPRVTNIKDTNFKSLIEASAVSEIKHRHKGDCQNCGPFLGTLNIRCRIIIGIQKGSIILTTTQMSPDWLCICHGLGGVLF